MSLNPLVIITGMPCTGKTTLGRRLSENFRLPYLHKDGIKERLFDSLGWSDREWSRRMGIATMDLFYYFLEIELTAGRSLIVESNFYTDLATPRFLALQEKYPFRVFQINCFSQGEVLVERWLARSCSKERHPGHVEAANLEEFLPAIRKGRLEPLRLEGELLELDTTDFSRVDYPAIIRQVEQFINQ
jgi:predicted kinase